MERDREASRVLAQSIVGATRGAGLVAAGPSGPAARLPLPRYVRLAMTDGFITPPIHDGMAYSIWAAAGGACATTAR
jgi:hypothetical protein